MTAAQYSWKISFGITPDFPGHFYQGPEVHEVNDPPLTGLIMSEFIKVTGDGKLAHGCGQTPSDCCREGNIWVFLPVKRAERMPEEPKE